MAGPGGGAGHTVRGSHPLGRDGRSVGEPHAIWGGPDARDAAGRLNQMNGTTERSGLGLTR